MNTFLPSADFGVCAFVLDPKRLNKQLVEGIQLCHLLEAMQGGHTARLTGFINHPVWKLWTTDEGLTLLPELVAYLDTLGREWQKRPGTRKQHVWSQHSKHFQSVSPRAPLQPLWPEAVHVSHRANLLRKDYSHYVHYFRMAGLKEEVPQEGYDWLHPRIVS